VEEKDSMTTISKSFLQVDGSDLFEEIYQKRTSLQLSSFESNDQAFNTSEISEPFQNISYMNIHLYLISLMNPIKKLQD